MDKIENLKQQLDYYDDLYYNKDNPELSDTEYDALKAQYLSLTRAREYTYVPGEAQFKKYTHTIPIKSLGKINTIQQVREEIKRLYPVVIEPKYDGLTLVIYPERKAITRGSGIIGEDVTHNVVKFTRVNHSYDYPVRGEAIMPISVFKEINKQRELEGKDLFKNPRNAIAGLLRNKDNSNIPNGLKFIAYELIGSPKSHIQQLLELRDFYEIPDANTIWNYSEIDDAVKFIENFDRSKLDYEIDGLVIKSNKTNVLDIFGETEHHPNHSIAYKFPNQGEWTILKAITRQIGRTGRVTPVGELEPVNILGSTIERATLHNERYIQALGLQINDRVFVVKSNDIIPAIIKCERTESSKPIIMENKCPSCGDELKLVNDQLFCENDDCPSKLLDKFIHFCSRDAMNIDGLSEAGIELFINQGWLKTFDDLYNLEKYKDQIIKLDGWGDKSYNKLVEAIKKSRKVKCANFIYALGIPQIGKGASKILAKYFKNDWFAFEEALNNDFDFTKLEDFGDITNQSLYNWYNNNKERDMWTKLTYTVEFVKEEKQKTSQTDNYFSGKKVYATGSFANYKKEEIKSLLEGLGAEFASGYAKSLDCLIEGSLKSSGKVEKAKKDGVPVISEKKFMELLKQ